MGSFDAVSTNVRDTAHHFKTDIFPFSIAIQPQDQLIAAGRFRLQMLSHVHFWISFVLHRSSGKQLGRIGLVPVVELGLEVDREHVTTNRSNFKCRRFAFILSLVLVNFAWTALVVEF